MVNGLHLCRAFPVPLQCPQALCKGLSFPFTQKTHCLSVNSIQAMTASSVIKRYSSYGFY